jgi:hypothetical protein
MKRGGMPQPNAKSAAWYKSKKGQQTKEQRLTVWKLLSNSNQWTISGYYKIHLNGHLNDPPHMDLTNNKNVLTEGQDND